MVVGVSVLIHVFAGLLVVRGGVGSDSLVFHGAVHPLHFAVGLGVIAPCPHRLNLERRHEFFEVMRDELAAIVVNEFRSCVRESHDEEVEDTADFQIRDVCMPVIVRILRFVLILFLRLLAIGSRPTVQKAVLGENLIHGAFR